MELMPDQTTNQQSLHFLKPKTEIILKKNNWPGRMENRAGGSHLLLRCTARG
jgi:hypothetical protein